MKSLKNKFKKNTDDEIFQWRAIDTVALSTEDNRLDILTEDEAIQVVLKGLGENDESAKDEYEESKFDDDKMYEEIDNNYFMCACCGYWHDIGESNESEDGETVCENCFEEES